jgi:hypothetical protein
MKRKSLIYCVMFLITSMFFACNKDTVDPKVLDGCTNMLYFDSQEELVTELNEVVKMSLEEKIQWEKSKGFNSTEITAENIYHKIDPEKFKSTDEIKRFVKENEKYLKLVKVENGEFELETCLNENPFKYFANQDGFFQVGESMYKVYSEGTISANSANFMDLTNMDYSQAIESGQYGNISNRMYSMEKSSPLGCLLQDELTQTNGNDRIKVSFYPSNSFTNEVLMNYNIRGYHKVLLIWFQVERTLECNLTIDCAYKNLSGNWDVHVFEYQNAGTVTTEISGYQQSGVICYPWQNNPAEVLGIYAYDAWAKQEYAELYQRTCSSY